MISPRISRMVLAFLFLGSLAGAATYYVAPSGNDNDPGTQAQPWKTVNKAVHTLIAGDTAYVAPGTYDMAAGPFTEPESGSTYQGAVGVKTINSGNALAPIRLVAQSSAAQIIGLGNSPSAQDDAHQAFIINGGISVNKPYWQIEGFYFKKNGYARVSGGPNFVFKNNLYFVDPRPSSGRKFDGGLQFNIDGHSDNALIEGNEFWSICFDCYREMGAGEDPRETYGWLFTLKSSTNVVVRSNIFYGDADDYSFDSAHGLVFESNQAFFGQEHLGGPANSDDWIFRNNVFYSKTDWGPNGGGQQGVLTSSACDIPQSAHEWNRNGQFYNNLIAGISAATILAQDSTLACPQELNGVRNLRIRNNIAISLNQRKSCLSISLGVLNSIDSDYNICLARSISGSMAHQYLHIYENPSIIFSLPQWQSDTQFPQILKDPHSRTIGPTLNGLPTVLGYATPLSTIGRLENDYADCGQYLGTEYVGVHGNCQPPYRMRILDDLRHIYSDSILRDAGDPAFGTNYPGGRVDIGPFEYTGGAPPATCQDGTPYGQCSATKPLYCLAGALVDQCGTCGCPSGQTCNTQTGSCTVSPTSCQDGTPNNQCSSNQPKYCQNGVLYDQCGNCGCPTGYTCNPGSGLCSINLNCQDGTLNGQCSTTQPKYCQSGNLIDQCGACGCPTGLECNVETNDCHTPSTPPAPSGDFFWFESEDFATRSGGWQTVSDPLASQSAYQVVPEGTGNDVGTLTYALNLAQGGSYMLWARGRAQATSSDSVYVSIDGGTENRWDFSRGPDWQWSFASTGPTTPFSFALSPGTHVLSIRNREDGTPLDRFLITLDSSFVPTGLGGQNVPLPSSCGNGVCATDESCASCPVDCGTCPQNPGGPGVPGNPMPPSVPSTPPSPRTTPTPTRVPLPPVDLTPTPFAFLPVTNDDLEQVAHDLPPDEQSQEIQFLVQNAKELESQGRFSEAAKIWSQARTRLNELILRTRQSKAASYYWVGALVALSIVAGALFVSWKRTPPNDPPILIKPETFLENYPQ